MISLQHPYYLNNYNLTPTLELTAKEIDPTMLGVFCLGLVVGAVALSHFQKSHPTPVQEQTREVLKEEPKPKHKEELLFYLILPTPTYTYLSPLDRAFINLLRF